MIITIGGRAGSGKSSTGRVIAKALGYDFYSAGDVRREYANANGLTIDELNEKAKTDPTSDFLVDDYMKELAKTADNMVLDSWLAHHFFPDSAKIYFDANSELRAKRIFSRKKPEELSMTVDEAFRRMTEKENCSAERYRNLYSVDIYDKGKYDLVVDTTGRTVVESALIVIDYVMHKELIKHLNLIKN
ncbi:cytidylate kinase family protein [Candidatus Woesearchaeota archaeon]|nr:cytidylate kinase family protein [Candidatus Woesearchaeota archaeon]